MKAQMRKLMILAGFALCLNSFARADLAEQIDSIIEESLQKRVRFSIHIIDANSGTAVYDHDAKELMIPASNMKIITGAAALNYLGPDYVYKTKVGLSGDALVVIGSGDPLLGDEKTDAKYGREPGWIFKDIANALKKKGIGTIEGIIVDSSVFDDEPVHPSWPEDEWNRWYACEVSGLNYNDNCVEISAKNIDGKIAVFVEPQTAFVSLINKVVPISTGSGAIGTYRNSQPNMLTVFGKCKDAVGPFDVAIERPAAYFGFLLYENLAEADIDAKGQLVEKTLEEGSDFVPLIEFSTPLTDCLARCNKNSLGLAAEAMLKTIAAMNNPDKKNGGWKRGQELISQFLLGLGLDKSQFYIDDGSGLSRQNELTAYAITTVLSSIYKSRNWELYKDTLAVGGMDGTIEKYFQEEKYKGKIFAKTGSITGVKSLSGLCVTDQGDHIFSILSNNINGQTRTVINNIVQAIIDEAESPIEDMTNGPED
jgi:D-alanyl-D-alanine carboxypeptidase/D-alanyl-D-alanine-endopeptidase (penicillin-binding protein 4)